MTRVTQEPAIVLHTRPYRETSLIVQLLTPNHGRVAAVVRGIRRTRRGHSVQPFNVLQVSWSGRTSLVTLTHFESIESRWLTGNALAAAYYVTELVVRLTREWEPHAHLFGSVGWVLGVLQASDDLEPALREFERHLLEELGYGLDFVRDASAVPIQADGRYRLDEQSGFIASASGEGYSGRALLEIGTDCYEDPDTRRAAKRIFRSALRVHLGPKQLLSRRLFRDGA